MTRIVNLAHRIGGEGFADMVEGEVEELLESHQVELTEEELEELIHREDPAVDNYDEEPEDIKSQQTMKRLAELVRWPRHWVKKQSKWTLSWNTV